MKTLLLIALVCASAGAASASAASPGGDRHARCEARWNALAPANPARSAGQRAFLDRCLAPDCPDQRAHEGGAAYGARARDYCEVRWRGLLAEGRTGGQTHDESIDACLRRCVAGRPGAPLGWILGGAGAAALAGAAAGGGHSTTPPASP